MLVSLFVFGSAALAEEPATPAKPPVEAPAAAAPKFEDFDANKDQSLDKAEVAKHEVLTRDFAAIDTDKNGKLSKDEFKAWADKVAKDSKEG